METITASDSHCQAVNLDSFEVPGRELRHFFSDRAKRLAEEAEQGAPIEPRELMLLVTAAREIIAFEAA